MKISQHPFLQQIDESQFEELSKVTVVEEYLPDTTIFEEGSPSDGLYLVLKGEVAFCKTAPDHSRREVSTTGEGSFFGEIGLFTDEPRAVEARSRGAQV